MSEDFLCFFKSQKARKVEPQKIEQDLAIIIGGLEHFLFVHILGIVIPTESYFSEGLKPPTSGVGCYTKGFPGGTQLTQRHRLVSSDEVRGLLNLVVLKMDTYNGYLWIYTYTYMHVYIICICTYTYTQIIPH